MKLGIAFEKMIMNAACWSSDCWHKSTLQPRNLAKQSWPSRKPSCDRS